MFSLRNPFSLNYVHLPKKEQSEYPQTTGVFRFLYRTMPFPIGRVQLSISVKNELPDVLFRYLSTPPNPLSILFCLSIERKFPAYLF